MNLICTKKIFKISNLNLNQISIEKIKSRFLFLFCKYFFIKLFHLEHNFICVCSHACLYRGWGKKIEEIKEFFDWFNKKWGNQIFEPNSYFVFVIELIKFFLNVHALCHKKFMQQKINKFFLINFFFIYLTAKKCFHFDVKINFLMKISLNIVCVFVYDYGCMDVSLCTCCNVKKIENKILITKSIKWLTRFMCMSFRCSEQFNLHLPLQPWILKNREREIKFNAG